MNREILRRLVTEKTSLIQQLWDFCIETVPQLRRNCPAVGGQKPLIGKAKVPRLRRRTLGMDGQKYGFGGR